LLHAAIKGLNRLARKCGVRLRQSYLRIAKRSAMMASRYAHAKQFKRHHRQLRLLRSRLGRTSATSAARLPPDGPNSRRSSKRRSRVLRRSDRSRQRQRGWKLYSFHAPEVECIGKGKAQRLTLGSVIDATEKLTGCAIERAYVDKGYRDHDAANPRRVFISGQKRGVFGIIKRELRRRSAIEPVMGHMKTDGHLGRRHLKGREGDARHTHRRRPPSSPCSRLAEGSAAPDPDRSMAGVRRHPGSQMGFFPSSIRTSSSHTPLPRRNINQR
jgi:transposase, IS5 family